jgi:hypothetical protein
MDSDALLARLEGVQPAGPGQWTAKCPVHDDREASLSIGTGRNGWLLHCHASSKCGVGPITDALGISWRDIFFDSPNPGGPVRIAAPAPSAPAPTSHRRDDQVDPLPEMAVLQHFETQLPGPVADRLLEVKGWGLDTLRWFGIGWTGERFTLPVRGPEGELLTVLGYVPGGSPKMKALKGRGRHLFPAPERHDVLDVRLAGKANLWLVEGEPDAISARELGVPAVAVPGVNTWRDWEDRFQGRRVTVCMDCDDQGRACAQERVDGFRRAGVEARAVDLDPSRSDGFDLSDALVAAREAGRVEDLQKYLARLWFEAWAA